MVDGSRHHRFIVHCNRIRHRWKFRPRTLYLFVILMSKSTQKEWLQLLILATSVSGLYFVFWKLFLPIIGASILVIGIIPPLRTLFLFSFNALMKFIGTLKTYLFMGITYFLILTPIAAIRGLFKKKKSTASSTLIARDHLFTPTDMENMW